MLAGMEGADAAVGSGVAPGSPVTRTQLETPWDFPPSLFDKRLEIRGEWGVTEISFKSPDL
jgi:hypothetical protein